MSWTFDAGVPTFDRGDFTFDGGGITPPGIYPYPTALPGITYDSVRAPEFTTAVQTAMTGKESRIARQQFPIMTWTLIYEFLRDSVDPSELLQLFGLFTQMGGRYGTFLYSDPVFNSVTAMPFATTRAGDVAGTPYQITATYSNSGGPGTNELIQNFNGVPAIQGNGTLISASNYALSSSGILTFNPTHQPTTGTVLSWTGSFYYLARFDDDSLDFTEIMNEIWELKSVKIRQVQQ